MVSESNWARSGNNAQNLSWAMSSAMFWGLDAAKAGGQLLQSTEPNIKDKKLLSFHQLLSTLEWKKLITNLPDIKLLLITLCLLLPVHANNHKKNSLIAVTSHVVTPWALSHCYCREQNLPSFQMTASSLQSAPSSQGGRWIPSLKNSHTWS